jgi:hypothetical protein
MLLVFGQWPLANAGHDQSLGSIDTCPTANGQQLTAMASTDLVPYFNSNNSTEYTQHVVRLHRHFTGSWCWFNVMWDFSTNLIKFVHRVHFIFAPAAQKR